MVEWFKEDKYVGWYHCTSTRTYLLVNALHVLVFAQGSLTPVVWETEEFKKAMRYVDGPNQYLKLPKSTNITITI